MRAIIRGTVLLAAALLLAPVAGRAATYGIDAVHSTVGFRIATWWVGLTASSPSSPAPLSSTRAADTRANATIEAASINTPTRADDHLRGADSSMSRAPTLTFVSRR